MVVKAVSVVRPQQVFRRFLSGAAGGRVVMGGKDVHVHIVAQLVGKLQAWK